MSALPSPLLPLHIPNPSPTHYLPITSTPTPPHPTVPTEHSSHPTLNAASEKNGRNQLCRNEPNPRGLSMLALQYNVLPHLPKVNKEQARMLNSSQLTVRKESKNAELFTAHCEEGKQECRTLHSSCEEGKQECRTLHSSL